MVTRGITRRLFLDGALKATLLAGVGGPGALGGVPGLAVSTDAAPSRAAAARRYDGELIEESYAIAHRLRDGTLEIPSLVPEGRLHDALIVGSGVSGLMAAWELQRGGLGDVLVYEKEDYVGGNARKGHANGTDYTCATWSVVRPRDAYLTRLFQDLDLIDGFAPDGTPRIKPELVGPGPGFNTLIGGAWYPQMDTFGADISRDIERMPIPSGDRRELIEFYGEMEAWGSKRGRDGRPAFAMPVEEGSRDPEILGLDRITMADYVRRKGWGPLTRAEVEDWSSSDIGGSASEVSAYAFWAFNSLGQGGEDITLPGGNAWLAERLAAKVGVDRLRTGFMVVRVENQGKEVRLSLLDPRTGRFSVRRARCAVLACPKHITGRMVPELRAAGRQHHVHFRYAALLMGAASVRRTPVLKGAPLAWFNAGAGKIAQGFLVADYNSDRWRNGDPRRPNVLCLWAPLAGKVSRAELLEKPWSHWAGLLADDLGSMVPESASEITRLDVYVWGHHMVIPYPGFLTGEARRGASRPLGRITFAHTDRHGMPSFELAARAGSDAAHEAIAVVRGGG